MRVLKWLLIALVALITIIGLGFVAYATIATADPDPAALAALEPTEDVSVEQGEWLVFDPAGSEPSTGLILYPGGFVDPQAYAPLARDIAAQGYKVVITPMPLNLAVFSPNAAQEVIDAFPEIQSWAVGGHSLGGAMASQFAGRSPAEVDGLVLWAAYPAGSNDLSAAPIAVTSIYATNDGLTTLDDIDASRALLPASTVFVPIEGGNHAQFGSYGPQRGDGEASIEAETQQAQVVEATVRLLEQISP